MTVVVAGCVAQAEGEEILRRAPSVDLVVGPQSYHRLPELIARAHRGRGDAVTAEFTPEAKFDALPVERSGGGVTAFLTVQEGCDKFCTFCVVPYTRGAEYSRPAAAVEAEARALAVRGVREVTLLGQNVNSYGRDLPARAHQVVPRSGVRVDDPTVPARQSFANLLAHIDAIEGIERIRYTSPHPKDMREDVIRAHAELQSVCEHIHLPLQSGSSRILKAMRRTYDRERYLDRVALIREHVPDVALTTDIIVGFPGESEEDFQQTLQVAEQVGYDGAFTFIFSPRRETEAAEMIEGVVPHAVKVQRLERLVEVVQRRARERAQRFVGRTVEVLVEGPSRTDPERMRGRTRHNKVVNFSGLSGPGELAHVEITAATSQTLSGEESLVARAAG
jgi:tRNA-2-methylthio-N6-dimethylallyladenosine synthase